MDPPTTLWTTVAGVSAAVVAPMTVAGALTAIVKRPFAKLHAEIQEVATEGRDAHKAIGGRIDSLRTELGNVRSDYPASASSSRFGRQPLLRVRAFGRVEPAYYVDAVACRPADGPWRHGVGAGPSGRQKRALSEVRQLTMRSLLGAACVTPTRSTSRETRDHGFREFRTKSGLECQLSRGSLDYKNGNSCTGLPTSARIGWPGKRHDSRRRSLAVPSEATEFSFHTLGDPEDVGALPNLVHLDLIGSVAAVRESGVSRNVYPGAQISRAFVTSRNFTSAIW